MQNILLHRREVSDESHDFIMAEIFRREALEALDSVNNTDSSGDDGSGSTAHKNSTYSDSEKVNHPINL